MDLSTALKRYQPIGSVVQSAFLRVAKRRTLPKGAILLSEGQISNEVHFVEEGLVRGFYYQDRKEITSWVALEGSFVWPLPSYLLRQPSREHIQLLEPATILSIERQDIEQLTRDYAEFDNLQCQIMERYIVLYELRVRLLLHKAEDRFEAYQQLFPELYRRVPLRYIATYLGMDPATLSRIRSGDRTKAGKKKS